MKAIEGVMYLLNREGWLVWVVFSMTFFFPSDVYSHGWYSSVKVTDPEGRINLTKSGEIGMNIWNISVETGHIVMLGFEQIDTYCYSYNEIPNSCECVRLEVYEGTKRLYQSCYSGTQVGLLVSSGSTMDIVLAGKQARESIKYFTAVYKSVLAENVNRSCGWNSTSQEGVIVSPGYPNNYRSLLICEWTIKKNSTTYRLQLEIQEYDIEQSYSCNFDSLEVHGGYDSPSSLLGRYCGKLDAANYVHLTSSYPNLFLRFVSNWNVTGAGFQAKWKTDRTYIHFIKPEVHIFYPSYCYHGECIWNITVAERNAIQLDITEYNMYCDRTHMYNPCDCSVLEVYDGPRISNGSLIRRHCHTEIQPPMRSSSNNMIIVLKNYQVEMSGTWRADYKTVNSSNVCSNFTSNGIVQSPHYPNDYPNNTDCSYTINMYNHGYQIVFNVTDIHLQDLQIGSNFCNDYVEIRIGYSATHRYCGNDLPEVVIANESTTVSFHSDGAITDPGFQLQYGFREFGCGNSTLTGQQGSITSPGYPKAFPSMINCSWTILVDKSHVINFVIDYIYMEGNGPEEGDYCVQSRSAFLQVFEETPDGNRSMNGPYCGYGVVPVPFISTTNNLTVEFKSWNNYYRRTGFSASFAALETSSVFRSCGGQLTGNSGIITSPYYPKDYPNNTVCIWSITGTTGYPIRISFSEFFLEDSNSCQKDSLELRDGPDTQSSRLDRLCGNHLPTDKTSSGNRMYLKFYSDSRSTFRGFNATWTSVCEQTSSSYSGTFTFPINTDVPPGKVQCTYVIQPNYYQNVIVRLTFSNFYLNDSSDCEHTYIEVRDGGFEHSPLLGSRYCGNSTPPVLTLTQNSAWIRFVTDGSQSNRFTITFDRPSVCGQTTLTGSEGRFTSPLYPSNYPLALTCTWTITPGPNSTVQLIFDDFLLETQTCNCPYDWVQLSEGNDPINLYPSSCDPKEQDVGEKPTPGKYCSNFFVREIRTGHGGNPLTLEFKSDSSRTFPGFSASYIIYDPDTDYLTRQYDLYPFGLEYGDSLLKPGDAEVQEIFISTGFPVANEIQNKAYVANKGLVTFKEPDTGKDFQLKENKTMICPYNSDIGANITTGGVYYQLHENNTLVLDKASAEVREFKSINDYNASIVLLITWDRVAHVKSSNPARDHATIQLALISNGIQSFALVYYRTGAMNWAHLEGEPLVIGVAIGKQVTDSIYSGSAEAFTAMDTMPGNAGNPPRKGMWIYDVGHSYSADQVCQNWINRNHPLDISRKEGFQRLPQCPCNKQFLRGTWLWSHRQDDYRVECYRLNFGTSRLVEPYGKECCYTQSGGQYVADGPFAGRATAYNPEIQNREYLIEDREAHDLCCYNTTTYKYCEKFYWLRPVGECTTIFPFGTSYTWGDPHIKTLDGNEYTFNGWGEYTMVTLKTSTVNFTLQGRTGLAETENGTLSNATVFKAFGAEENGVRVFVELDPNTNNTMILYANDVDYTLRFYKEGNSFLEDREQFMLRRENDSIYISFISGIDITVTVSFKSLEIAIALPMAFQNQTRGLLGNFNGIKNDDFVLPNGTTLRSNLTDRQIFYLFGNEWAVTQKNSVMRYGIKEGPANYSHPEFTPIFLDEQPNDTRKAAEDLCGVRNLACVYDYIATKSAAFASATKQTAEIAEITVKARKNTVPTLFFNSTLRMNAGETLSFNLNGSDPDPGDNLTYFMVDNTENDAVQLDTYTGQVTLKVNLSQLVSPRFYAVDNSNMHSPISEIYMVICSRCSGHGTCDFDHAVISDAMPNVQIATCICNTGWSGPDCSVDYNACAESPCSTHQNCTDLTPDEQGNSTVGFKCSDCSQGYQNDVTDRTRCWDVDECLTNSTNKCSVKCWNTPGSYTCGCNYGYRLNRNGISCDDINECAEHLDICEQTCLNKEGSYLCSCYQGYTLSGAQDHCEKSSSSNSDQCQTEGCSHGCSMQASANGSLVPTCFCNTGFEMDANNTKLCVDKDECKDEICSQACRNTDGSFACSCYPGNKLSSDQRTCIPCDKLRYGDDCLMTCECSGRGVECNPISGCVCQTGWTGEHCETDVNECEKTETPCPIGQICTNTDGSFTCNCPIGYLKQSDGTCEDVDECSDTSILNTCTRLEVCVNSPGTFSCECKMGYTHTMPDSNCTDIDECANSDVACEQQCTNVQGSYNCHCHYGYRLNADRTSCSKVADVCAEFEGLHCEHGCTINDTEHGVCICNTGYQLAANQQNCTDINECTVKNNCSHNCTNTVGGFYCSCPIGMKLDNSKLKCRDCPPGTYGLNCSQVCACGVGALTCDVKMGCICKPGWSGDKCDHDIDECDDQNVLLDCHNKSAGCINFQGGYNCRCWKGYEQSGNNTCRDIDECRSNPCHHICENSLGSYRCLCQTGFTLNASSNICEDLNECELSGTHACQQQCDNIAGSYRCSCNKDGFVLENDGVSCKATSNCSNITCPTENGGCSQERCFCNSGYELNVTSNMCIVPDIDWCANSTCEQTCTETEDGRSFRCGCTDGYLLNSDRRHCRECMSGSYGKNCSENCTCITANMVSCNTVNGTCTCKPGRTGVNCESDIDECNELCIPPASCTNTPGSYVCSCGNGYTKNQGTCQDINECEETHGCKQHCNNTEGSYSCFCDSGYVLSADNITCIDINECEGTNVCNQHCNNTDGSYICFCNSGYALSTDNVTCVDINECEGTHNCTKYCNNTEGSYNCFCNEGYVLSKDNVTCVDSNECLGAHRCTPLCVKLEAGYHCSCNSGYTLSSDNVTCEDVNECESSHGCHTCFNRPGSFSCNCKEGFRLNADNKSCDEISRINFELKLDITEKVDLSNEDTYNALRLHCQVQLSEFILPRASGVLEVEIISIRVGSLIFEAAAVVLKELQQESALGLVVALTELSRTNVTIGNFTGRASVTLFPPGGRLPVLINGNTNPCKVATETSICADEQECIELDEKTIFCRHIESKDISWFLVVVLSTAIPAAIIVLSLAIFVCVYCKNKKHRKNEADNMFSSTRARDAMEMRTNMKIHASISQNSQYSISRPRVSSRGNALMN